MIALLLAAALAFPPDAQVVRLSEDAWPEQGAVETLQAGQRVWWWSRDCAPQVLTYDAPNVECTKTAERVVQVIDRGSGRKLPRARVVWGTEAMLADLPDALLPFALTDDEGSAVLRIPRDTVVQMRVDGPRVASWWQTAEKIAAVPAAPQSLKVNAAFARVQLELAGTRSMAVARDGVVALPALPPVPMMMIAWGRESAPVAMNVDAAALPRTLDLPRGTEVTGRIVDSQRRPLEGVAIEAVFPIANLPRGLRRRVQSTRAGTFTMRGVPPGLLQLTFKKPDRATLLRGIDATDNTDLGDITLRPSRSLIVKVTDIEGEPVAHANVRAAEGASATTDRDGVARLHSIAADDDVTIQVTAAGFRASEITAGVDAKAPLAIELSRGVRVIGKLGNAEAGDVLVINNGGQRIVKFDGSAIDIGGLDAGTLALEIRASGVAPHSIPQRTILADETWNLGELQLDEGASLIGRVVDRENDAPLADVRVRALRPRAMGAGLAMVMSDWIETTSREDGSFRITGLTTGSHVVLIDAAGYASRVIEAEKDAGEIALDRARTLLVECAPVARCGSGVRLLYAGAQRPWASLPALLQDGKARIVSAAPGNAVLRFVRGGEVLHERIVQIGTTSETTVRVQLATATLRGTVMTAGRARRGGGVVELRSRTAIGGGIPIYVEHRTPEGQPTGGAWQSEIPSFEMTVVDDAGNFVFAELEPGEYDAIYRGDGVESKTSAIVVRPGTSHITLDVAPANDAMKSSAR